MPIDFNSVSEHRLFITRFHGIVTNNDIEFMYAAIFNHSDINPGYIELSLHEDDLVLEVTKKGFIAQIFGIFKDHESVLFFLKNQRISDGLKLFLGQEDVTCLKD